MTLEDIDDIQVDSAPLIIPADQASSIMPPKHHEKLGSILERPKLGASRGTPQQPQKQLELNGFLRRQERALTSAGKPLNMLISNGIIEEIKLY